MDQERLPSFLFSLCLHLGLFVLVLFWPAPSPPLMDLNPGPVITGIVTIGKEGKATPKAQQSAPDAGRQERVEKPKPPEPEKPNVPQVEHKPVPPEKPEVKPEVKPVEKPVEKVPDATPIPKEPEKPTKNATAQAAPAKNATVPQTAAKPAPKEDLGSALADLRRDTGKRGATGSTAGKGQNLSSALSDLGKEVGGSGTDAYGTGPGGRGGDGVGILGAYEDSIVSRVKPNWSWPGRTDRRNYIAVVNVKIAADGAIKDVRISRSSGNSYFDATVLRAVTATRQLEPPPKPEYMDMDILFNSEDLARR